MYSIACLIPDVEPISHIRTLHYPYDHHPHITLVYPFDLSYIVASEHVGRVLKNIHPFNIVLEGFSRSETEFYLYLNVKEGISELRGLHEKFHSGSLKHNNIPMPKYIPHLTLGVFSCQDNLDKVLNSLNSDPFSFCTRIDSVQLINVETGYFDSFPL